jgi:hypothetical protein
VVSGRPRTHAVRVHEPEVDRDEVVFSWTVSPPSELYRRTSFRLTFPPEIDARSVPRQLWWRIALICLHTHWALLRPCRVELPVRLGPREREFWQRLIDNVAVQVEAYGGTPCAARAAELVESGQQLDAVPLGELGNHAAPTGRVAVAFSGGKDSLVLTALLAELTERPLLVTTTSPVPWARDHVGSARERARVEIARRLPVDVIEVRSDFRTSWDLDFASREGCRLGVHELSDLPLFQSAMVAVAAASGVTRTFLASEADIQYNTAREGKVILHPEFLSCAVTQQALDALLRTFGLRMGSLSYPLHMPQVQALLLRRYRNLADLQFSCWRAPEGEQSCSACPKCFQVALVTLAEGTSPRAVGIDLVQLLTAFGDWRLDTPAAHRGPRLHQVRSARHHIIRCLQAVPTERVASILEEDPIDNGSERLGEALAVYARLRADALALSVPPAPGYIAGFLDAVDPDLREPLRAIFDQHFSPAPQHEFADVVGRSRALATWIAEPLERPDRRWSLRRPRRELARAGRRP